MILWAYLSGTSIVLKLLQIVHLSFLLTRSLKITFSAFVCCVVLFSATLHSAFLTSSLEPRLWAQVIMFAVFCVIGCRYDLLKVDKLFWLLAGLMVLLTLLFWLADFNFPVGKGRMFLDDNPSGIIKSTINGFGSEVNYTAFFFILLTTVWALQSNSIWLLFAILPISVLQNADIGFLIFGLVFVTFLFKRAYVVPLVLLIVVAAIVLILSFGRQEAFLILGPRAILWLSSFDVISRFPEFGSGYENTREMIESVVVDFDKQYYVHNGFLEAGMAAGPTYAIFGSLILIYKLISFSVFENWKYASLMGMTILFVMFNSGFLGSVSLGGVLLSYLIGVPSRR